MPVPDAIPYRATEGRPGWRTGTRQAAEGRVHGCNIPARPRTHSMNRQSRSVTRAATLITDAGGRTTPARRAVLEILLAAKQALNHQEIEQSLRKRGSPCDRVTLYRVLEWLVSHRLAHKIVGDDRVWRFNTVHNDLEAHPHFQCTHCRQVYC
ncbi:MAG: Fur family transcriptional regulator, partial [Candidatus Methylomirabilales bacterium]